MSALLLTGMMGMCLSGFMSSASLLISSASGLLARRKVAEPRLCCLKPVHLVAHSLEFSLHHRLDLDLVREQIPEQDANLPLPHGRVLAADLGYATGNRPMRATQKQNCLPTRHKGHSQSR